MDPRNQSTLTSLTPLQAGPVSSDPLVEPLIVKLAEISRQLDEFRNLVTMKTEEVKALYKAATLLYREEAAERMAVSESQLDREVDKGKLPIISIDRRPRFSLPDLEAYINARRTTGRRRSYRGPAAAAIPSVQSFKSGAKRAKLKAQRLK